VSKIVQGFPVECQRPSFIAKYT